jgi:hypothetical protein
MIRALSAAPAPAAAPTIAAQPRAQSVAAGGTVVFSVEASNAARYQWKRNGTAIPGATQATLTLAQAAPADAGNYTVEVSNATGSIASAPAALAVETAAIPGRIVNLSVRSAAGVGAQTLTVGFILDGAEGASFDRELLLRGIGPSLAPYGLSGVLPDPKISLFRGSTLLMQADNWWEPFETATDGISGRFGAWTLPVGSRDAVLSPRDLTRGAYSMQISSVVAGQSGLAMAEIYDTPGLGTGFRQLVNVSARSQVTSGSGTLIAGFIIGGGTTARTVLIRAGGPALTGFNVPGTLADPKLTLYRENTPIAENDNWQTSSPMVETMTAIGAFAFIARSRDAVLYLTLEPGLYSAHVSGVTTPNGVALVEIYVLP